MEEKLFYPPKEASKKMGININTLYRYLKMGYFGDAMNADNKIGRKYFLPKDVVDNFLRNGKCINFAPVSDTKSAWYKSSTFLYETKDIKLLTVFTNCFIITLR